MAAGDKQSEPPHKGQDTSDPQGHQRLARGRWEDKLGLLP
jgi:hypothetical protein